MKNLCISGNWGADYFKMVGWLKSVMDNDGSQLVGLTMVSCHFSWFLVSKSLQQRAESKVICIDVMRYNKMDGVSVRTLLQARCIHSTSPFLRMLSLVSWVVCVDTSPRVFFKAFITSPVLCHPLRGSRTCLLIHTTPAGSSWEEWWGDGVDLPLPKWMT